MKEIHSNCNITCYHFNTSKIRSTIIGLITIIVCQFLITFKMIQNPSNSKDGSVWEEMRILCFMTTHLSQQHIDVLGKYWPEYFTNVSMLRNSDLLIYVNNEDDELIEEKIGKKSYLMENVLSRFRSVKISKPPESDIDEKKQISDWENYNKYEDDYYNSFLKHQSGAMLAMKYGFAEGWFDEYDWVYRVNPDVIIRDDSFFEKAFSNDDVDGVFVECNHTWIHTDFFAFRVNVMPPNSFQLKKEYDVAEKQAFEEFHHILDSGRFQWLEGARPEKPGYCRLDGEHSPVIHKHADDEGLTDSDDLTVSDDYKYSQDHSDSED